MVWHGLSTDAMPAKLIFLDKIRACGNYPSTPKIRVLAVTSNTLNLRNGSSTSTKIVAKVKKGELLAVTGSRSDWHEIVDENCNRGWVAGYLTREIY